LAETLGTPVRPEPAPTLEQRPIIEAGPNERLLVTAGPGTGKTFVLIARLAYLIEHHGIAPGSGVLVLSFSRAAVSEIRRRAEALGGDLAYATVQTFDSFATRLVSEIDPETDFTGKSYDDRIAMAVALIEKSEAAQAEIGQYQHIFVDEIQDLVGVRSELVKRVLTNARGGFTLLGDPAQGIFNFQATGDERRVGAAALYEWLRYRFDGNLTDTSLKTNHRVMSEAAKAGLFAGALLNAPNPDYAQILFDLKTALMRAEHLGTVAQALPFLRTFESGQTAILCRTNGQVLQISRELFDAQLSHRVQRSATDRTVPGWVAAALTGLENQIVGKTRFREHLTKLAIEGAPDAADAWVMLSHIGGRSGDQLDVAHLAERIRTGNVPDELIAPPQPSQLLVSTVHRAKGLEFERVAVPDFQIEPDDEDLEGVAETARLLYVALTRAKNDLLHLSAPDTRGMHISHVCDRWVRTQRRWQIVDLEVRGADVHSGDPAGGFLLSGSEPLETQQYIAASVRPGDPVTLRLLDDDSSEPGPYYVIEHEGRSVGVTSSRFAEELSRLFHGRSSKGKPLWPEEIQHLHVEEVDSVAGSRATGKRWGLGISGIWLRVRVSGLGSLVF